MHINELKIQSLESDEVQEVLNSLDAYLTHLRDEWDAEDDTGGRGWVAINRTRLINGTSFIIRSLDRMVQFVEDLIPEGKDKKAAVLLVTTNLFDYIVVQAFPLWMKPFVPTIRRIIVQVVVASMIDFVVGKYRENTWRMEDATTDVTKEEVNVEKSEEPKEAE